ncbi:MAG TPA: SMP-30/gluconolactonase/LRE family protein [Solirubrobacterales bacterium]|nr:SMP-30/gluconolactonase/LRE family protein [Solirubrobacterales bacterium]
MTLTPTTLLDGLVFPEGLRWHDGRLWLSDMYAGKVLAVDLDGAVEEIAAVPGRPSGLGFLPDGTPLVVSMEDHKLLRLEPGGAVEHADLTSLVTGHINDMLVTPSGRAYVGNFGFDFLGGEDPKPANVVVVEPDGSAQVAADGLMFPNGMALADGGATLLVAEMLGGKVTAFAVAADGTLTDPRTWAELPERTPDGIALDADGNLWIASSLSAEALLVAPGGEVLELLSTAPRLAPACALGGPDGDTLFLALAETSPEQLAQGISKGQIDTVSVAVAAAA